MKPNLFIYSRDPELLRKAGKVAQEHGWQAGASWQRHDGWLYLSLEYSGSVTSADKRRVQGAIRYAGAYSYTPNDGTASDLHTRGAQVTSCICSTGFGMNLSCPKHGVNVVRVEPWHGEVMLAPGCYYWPARGSYAKHDALLKAVQATAKLVGWSVEETMDGAWLWHSDPVTHMGYNGFATPEWEGRAGQIPLNVLDESCTVADDVILKLELTGNPEMDALRVVLKVVNAFVRGY